MYESDNILTIVWGWREWKREKTEAVWPNIL